MVELIRKKELLLATLQSFTRDQIGLVPTMGNLHQGHITLAARSLEENPLTIVTIFVNPTQFGPTEDLAKYPRTLEADLNKLEAALFKQQSIKGNEAKRLIVFAPENEKEIYPSGFNTSITVGSASEGLCGTFRPTHFAGVATVVYILFALTKPKKAYFGLKDFQQVMVIEQMVRDLMIPVQIVPMDTVRDEDGLALSSRNQYLSEHERQLALSLPRAIKSVALEIKSCQKFEQLQDKIDSIKSETSTDSKIEWQYLEIRDRKTFKTPTTETNQWVILGAMKVGQTRLIDNLVVN